MFNLSKLIGALTAAVIPSLAFAEEPQHPRIQVMVLAAYHFENPGQDVVNVTVDDVTTEKRQAELEKLTQSLVMFRPTHVAIEDVGRTPDLTLEAYEAFDTKALSSDRNENTQIGFRLARAAGLTAVHGVDERSDVIDYFPFGAMEAFAAKKNLTERLGAIVEEIQAQSRAFEAEQGRRTISQSLRHLNEPAVITAQHEQIYYGFFAIGDGQEMPGADLNAAWYWRNARIFAKLKSIAEPGDRLIVVFGSGHAYWLRHFIKSTPGFELVEANTYLPE